MQHLIPPDDCGHKGAYMSEDGPRCAYCNLLLNKNQLACISKQKIPSGISERRDNDFLSFVKEMQGILFDFCSRFDNSPASSSGSCPHGAYYRETGFFRGKTHDSGWRCALCHASVVPND